MRPLGDWAPTEVDWFRHGMLFFLFGAALRLLCGCAFDVSYVTRVPATFQATTTNGPEWTLGQARSVGVGSGFPTRLRQGTRWRLAGHTPQGDVYQTSDQIVTVEASNTFEAMIVIRGNTLIGFYLPVEHSFVAATDPLPINRGTQP